MRTPACLLVVLSAFAAAAPRGGGDGSLLNRFKQQNEQARERLQNQVKEALDKAQALEKDEPARALGLLQDTRDRLLERGLLASREDRALAEPLWERIVVLRAVLRDQRARELRLSLADFKEYIARMNEEFALLRAALIPPAREMPRGGPAVLAFVDGKQAVGWLHEPPLFVVQMTVNDQLQTYAGGLVVGVETPQEFFVYDRAAKRFTAMTRTDFFVRAIASYPPARRPGFWLPPEIPPPPPGFTKRSVGALAAALFARGVGVLMSTWARPGSDAAERAPGAGGGNDAETARLYRDVLVELQVQEIFHRLKREDQDRVRNAVMTFLDRRPGNGPLSAEEIVGLSDAVSEVYPELRSDAVAFGHILNRHLEQAGAKKAPAP